MDETPSLVILSEMGLERRRWPTVQHCTAWLGLCPHHRVSGGTVLRRRTTPCANRAATALRMGAPKAITTTAHKLARLLDSMRKHGTAYVRQGRDEYAQQSRDRTVKNWTRRAKT